MPKHKMRLKGNFCHCRVKHHKVVNVTVNCLKFSILDLQEYVIYLLIIWQELFKTETPTGWEKCCRNFVEMLLILFNINEKLWKSKVFIDAYSDIIHISLCSAFRAFQNIPTKPFNHFPPLKLRKDYGKIYFQRKAQLPIHYYISCRSIFNLYRFYLILIYLSIF